MTTSLQLPITKSQLPSNAQMPNARIQTFSHSVIDNYLVIACPPKLKCNGCEGWSACELVILTSGGCYV